ncbi:MAG: hydroxyacid dehydrogenase [Clostridiaceae bacterium]|nr:hydroxyacid dehydrogenase [Clostridiaceae bacterium]
MKKINILVTIPLAHGADQFINPDIVRQIEELGPTTWNESGSQFSQDQLRQHLKKADVCLTGWGCPCFDAFVLEQANRLKLVAHTGGSVAPIVSDALFDRQIRVISGNKLYAESVAEGVIGYLLGALRKIPYYDLDMKKGGWQSDGGGNEGLLDQTVGLVGFGMVGRYLAQMLAVFRVKVKVYDPFTTDEILQEYNAIRVASLDDLFASCRIVSIHAPKTPETYHMIDGRLLKLLPDGAIFVNTARGSLVDEAALADELRKNRIRAVLDVYETEPLPADHPFRSSAAALLMPHMAGPTVDRRPMVTVALIEDIKRFFAGEALRYEISSQYARGMTR